MPNPIPKYTALKYVLEEIEKHRDGVCIP
jgi:hypothetical protein